MANYQHKVTGQRDARAGWGHKGCRMRRTLVNHVAAAASLTHRSGASEGLETFAAASPVEGRRMVWGWRVKLQRSGMENRAAAPASAAGETSSTTW